MWNLQLSHNWQSARSTVKSERASVTFSASTYTASRLFLHHRVVCTCSRELYAAQPTVSQQLSLHPPLPCTHHQLLLSHHCKTVVFLQSPIHVPSHILQSRAWWKDSHTPFSISNCCRQPMTTLLCFCNHSCTFPHSTQSRFWGEAAPPLAALPFAAVDA